MLPTHRLQLAATALKADVFSLTHKDFDGLDKSELQRALLKAEQLNAAECEFAEARQAVVDSLRARLLLIEKGKDDAQNTTAFCCCPCHELAGTITDAARYACDSSGDATGTGGGSASKNKSGGRGNR